MLLVATPSSKSLLNLPRLSLGRRFEADAKMIAVMIAFLIIHCLNREAGQRIILLIIPSYQLHFGEVQS